MTTHLRYDLMEAGMGQNENRHAQVVMKELGITYQHATPQSIADQWWFWNCENVPESLPPYLTLLDINPMDAIGYGLSKEDADRILNHDPLDAYLIKFLRFCIGNQGIIDIVEEDGSLRALTEKELIQRFKEHLKKTQP